MAISIHFVTAPYAVQGMPLAMLFLYNGLEVELELGYLLKPGMFFPVAVLRNIVFNASRKWRGVVDCAAFLKIARLTVNR
jgi:hypothetical protein